MSKTADLPCCYIPTDPQELDDLMASPGMTAACQLLTEHRSIGSCDACAFRNLCLGGCMGLALDHAGTVYGVDDFCQYRKTVYSQFEAIVHLLPPAGDIWWEQP